MKSRLRAEWPALAALSLICAVGLLLRILNNDYGLPYVYYVDEGSHFTKRAVEMFRDPSPGYFQNPSAYTYVLHGVFRVMTLWYDGIDGVVADYRENKPWIYVAARSTAAGLCMFGVIAIYLTGRALWDRRTGLVAAAVLSFGFLPVAFSRIAVTDVGTLAPIAAALALSVLIVRRGANNGTCIAAGVAVGLAVAFKYTAGLIILAPLLALVLRYGRQPRELVKGAVLVGAVSALSFAITNPYFFIDFDDALRQLRGQAELAGTVDKFGQEGVSGPVYYLGSLTWGLGWVVLAFALVGAALLARKDKRALAVLLIFPLALFIYLSMQSRYFGRWLLPVYPALALLAGYGFIGAIAALRQRWRAPVAVLAGAALLWQPLAADARSMSVLGREDTRGITHRWLAKNYPPDLRAVVEPAVPTRWLWRLRHDRPVTPRNPQIISSIVRTVRTERVEYGRSLGPQLLDEYRRRGYCVVVTFDLIRGRAVSAKNAEALAYYKRLEDESELVYTLSPYRDDRDPPPFSFDLSYTYYSSAYARPGSEARIYQLNDCRQRFGKESGS